MKLIDKQYVSENKKEILDAIISGAVFIYPTDTIYGLGTNALLDAAVDKLRVIKKREQKPFSVIAPSRSWILENFHITEADLDKYLPGPYTLFLNKRESCRVSKHTNPSDDTLGVRIPSHWFASIVSEADVPFVTTSVNISGDQYMKKLEDVPQEILDQVDYVVYEGENGGSPSIKVDFTGRFD